MSLTSGPRLWAVIVRADLDAFGRLGLDTEEICRRSGLTHEMLADSDGWVPLEVCNRAWLVADALWGKPALGLCVAEQVPFGAYQTFDYLLLAGASVREGIDALVRNFHFVSEGVMRLTRVDLGSDEALGLNYAGPVPMHVRDYVLCALTRRIQYMGGRLLQVDLAGPALGPLREYERIFGESVHFEQPSNLLRVGQLDARPSGPAKLPGLHAIVGREAERLVAKSQELGTLGEVRAAIVALLPSGRPRLDEVAQRLRVVSRTLQRRLSAEGVSFVALVEEIRRERALEYLTERQLSVAEAAYLLGFAEPASFTRACIRWFGQTPTDVRSHPERSLLTALPSSR